jgi:hypothetical protein
MDFTETMNFTDKIRGWYSPEWINAVRSMNKSKFKIVKWALMLIYLQRPRCWETYVQSSTLEPSNLQLSKLTRLQIMLSQYVRSVIDWLIKQLDAEISNMQSYLYTDNADKRSTFKSFFSFVFCRHFTNTNGPILFWIPQLHFRLCNQRYISWRKFTTRDGC